MNLLFSGSNPWNVYAGINYQQGQAQFIMNSEMRATCTCLPFRQIGGVASRLKSIKRIGMTSQFYYTRLIKFNYCFMLGLICVW